MEASERRFEIIRHLCIYRYEKITVLANMFAVSKRTIQRDLYKIETSLRVPLLTKSGKYEGGVYIAGNYTFDRMYMDEDEIALLRKSKILLQAQLTEEEKILFDFLIKKYTPGGF